jgi:hypothetical protein
VIEDWPLALQPQEVACHLARASRMGPQPLDGPPMALLAPTMHWRIMHTRVRVTPDLALVYEALAGRIAGMAGPIMISPWRFRSTPRQRALSTPPRGALFVDDFPMFDPASGPAVDFTVGVNAARGVTALRAPRETTGLLFEAGQYLTLGVGDARALHRIIVVTPVDAASVDLTLRPGLRAAATAGDAINSEDPRCPCVCVSPTPDMSFINGFYGYADLEFQEVPR